MAFVPAPYCCVDVQWGLCASTALPRGCTLGPLISQKEEAQKEAEPDEEGWVVVTRVGKNKGAPRTEAEDRRVKQKEGRKRKRKVNIKGGR